MTSISFGPRNPDFEALERRSAPGHLSPLGAGFLSPASPSGADRRGSVRKTGAPTSSLHLPPYFEARSSSNRSRPPSAGAVSFRMSHEEKDLEVDPVLGFLGSAGASAAPAVDERVKVFASRLPPFLRTLSSHLRSKSLADMTLVAEGLDFPCHRLALCSASEFWAKAFDADQTGDTTALSALIRGYTGTLEADARVPIMAHTSVAVEQVLRIMYFESTTFEVLHEDHTRVLPVISLAVDWLLRDVIEDCRTFVEKHVTDVDIVNQILGRLGVSDLSVPMRETCFQRARFLREQEAAATAAAAATKRARDLQVPHHELTPLGISGLGRGPRQDGARWPMGGGGELWSTPVRCPRGFGF